jgi:hypothetical protein
LPHHFICVEVVPTRSTILRNYLAKVISCVGDQDKKITYKKTECLLKKGHKIGMCMSKTDVSASEHHKIRVSNQTWLNTKMIFNKSHQSFACHKYFNNFKLVTRCILTIWFRKRSHHAHLFNQELDKEPTIVETIKEAWDHRHHICNQ